MPGMIQVDCRDVKWPRSIGQLSRVYNRAKNGDIIELLTTDCTTEEAARRWCERTGNKEVKMEHDASGVFVIVIRIAGKKAPRESNHAAQGKRHILEVKSVKKGAAK